MSGADQLGWWGNDVVDSVSDAARQVRDAAGDIVDKVNNEVLKPVVDPIADQVSSSVDQLGPVGSALKQTWYIGKGQVLIIAHPKLLLKQYRAIYRPTDWGSTVAEVALLGGASAKQAEQLGRIGDMFGGIIESLVRGVVVNLRDLTVAQGRMYVDLARGDFSGALEDFKDATHASIKLGVTVGAVVGAVFTGGATLIILAAVMAAYKTMDGLGLLPMWLSASDGQAKGKEWWATSLDVAATMLPAIAPAAGAVLGATAQSGNLAATTALAQLAQASTTVSTALSSLNTAASFVVRQITAIAAYVQEVVQHLPAVVEIYEAMQVAGVDMLELTVNITRGDYREVLTSSALSMARNYGLPVDVVDDYLAEIRISIRDLSRLDNIQDTLSAITTQYVTETYLGDMDPDAVQALIGRDYRDCATILATKYGTQFVDKERLLVGTGLTIDDARAAIKGKPPAQITALQAQYVALAQSEMVAAKNLASGILGQENVALIRQLSDSSQEAISRMGTAQLGQVALMDQTMEVTALPHHLAAPEAGISLPGGNPHIALAKYDLARARGAAQVVKADIASFQASRVIDANVALIAIRDSRIRPNVAALAQKQQSESARVGAALQALDQSWTQAQSNSEKAVASATAWVASQQSNTTLASEALLGAHRQAVVASRDASLATLLAAATTMDQFTSSFSG